MSTNETLKGNPEEYVLFKDEEETTTDVKYDTKSNCNIHLIYSSLYFW